MREWYTALELAELRLPTLPTTKAGVIGRAQKNAWQKRRRAGRGGGWEYHVSALPPAAREALAERMMAVDATVPAVREAAAVPAARRAPLEDAELKDWQRRAMEGRLALLAEVERLVPMMGLMAARELVARLADEGRLQAHLQEMVAAANARGGKAGTRTLTVASLRRWDATKRAGGMLALAPRPTVPERTVPPTWMAAFGRYYFRPQKPSAASCYELAQRDGIALPSLRTVQQEIKKLPATIRHRGRVGPRQMKAFKAYVVRDASDLWPTAVYTSDGHTFDAEVAHPLTGKAFRPEITSIIDVYTRRIVGWSISLAEAALSTADALRHAVMTSGVPDIFYVDNGKGFNNAIVEGLLARLGTTKTNSIAYNSQARGVIERLHQSVWVRAAKLLPTYMGAAMDDEARQRAYKRTRADLEEVGTSRLLMSWADFLGLCSEQVALYNARPHSALPKMRDPETGKLRHQSPDEVWMGCRADGWEPDRITGPESDDLFRPQITRQVRRAMISLFSNSYFAPELEPYHGEDVLVGYDVHDANQVWVRDLDQRLICVAQFEGNRRGYYAKSYAEQTHERRISGQLNRAENKVRAIREEANPTPAIEHQPAVPLPLDSQRFIDLGERLRTPVQVAPAPVEPSDEAKRRRAELAAEMAAGPAEPHRDDRRSRIRHAQEIEAALAAGEEVAADKLTWFGRYREQSEWRSWKAVQEDLAPNVSGRATA